MHKHAYHHVYAALVALGLLALSILAPAPLTRFTHAQESDSLYRLTVEASRAGWDAARHLRVGDLWQARGDLSAAAAHYAAALAQDSASHDAARALARVSLRLGRFDVALHALETAVTLDANDLWSRYHLGMTLTAYDARGALVHLVAASSANPETASALIAAIQAPQSSLMTIGAALIDRSEWGYAENAFHEAHLRAGDAESLAFMALARAAAGKDALPMLEAALAQAPENPRVRYAEALTRQRLRDYNGALAALNAGLMFAPDDPALYAAVGAVLAETGDVIAAQTWYDRAVSISRDDAQFIAAREAFRAQYGDAISASTQALDEAMVEVRAVTPADVQAQEGWTLWLSGDAAGGLALIDAALASDPDSLLAQFYKANLLLQSGDSAGARPYLERVAASESPLAALAQQTLAALNE